MSDPSRTILIVNDDEDLCELLAKDLASRGYRVDVTTDTGRCSTLLRQTHYSVMLADGPSWLVLREEAAVTQPGLPVVILTDDSEPAMALESIHAGVYDVVTRPLSLDALSLTLTRAVDHRQLADEVAQLQRQVRAADQIPEIIGRCAAMRVVYDLINRVSATDASVLVTGESGTGKELVARAIHDRSGRRAGPFVAINCAAVPPTVLDRELFGHDRVRPGLFLLASGGTLYLDEIGAVPLEMQAKVLRMLQEQRVRPAGRDHGVPFDTRLISATDRDLEARIDTGAFRGDLYRRINVVHIELPALRARGHDILLIAHHLIQQAATTGDQPPSISASAARKLLDYHWPGNVRELQNCIAHAVALAPGSYIRVDDLPDRVREFHRGRITTDGAELSTLPRLRELQRRYIHRVLDAVSGNKTHASRILGMDRRTLYRKLARLDGARSAG